MHIRYLLFSLFLCFFLPSCDWGESSIEKPKANVIAGKVQAYTGGDATLEAHLLIDSFKEGAKVGSGSIKADGSFTVTLDDTVAGENLTSLDNPCEGVTMTPSTFRSAGILFLSIVKAGKTVAVLVQASSADAFTSIPSKVVTRIYADQAASIQGTCQGPPNNIFNLNYKKGWNISLKEATETSIINSTIDSSDLPWFYSPTQ